MSKEFFDAIKQGDKDEVERRLLRDPILIHAKEAGLSPIMVAAYHHEPAIASFLADKTVAINIFEAAATGKINNIIRLLARDPKLVSAYSEDGFQPLGLAAFFGHLDSAEYLVKAGAPVNAISHSELGAAPIQSAAAGGNTKIVKMLLEHRADPNIRERGGYTPLHAAAQNGEFCAFDAATGKILWKSMTGNSTGGGVISYAVNGKQYIAIAVGMKSPIWKGVPKSSRILIYGL